MKRSLRIFALAPLGLVLMSAHAAEIKLMTQNQYFGADFGPLVTAQDAVEFNNVVVESLQTIAANLPAERMKALADMIRKEQPELVGLQEVFRLTCTDLAAPPVPGTGCSHPSLAGAFTDHLQATLDALDGAYVVAATVVNLDVPALPFVVEGVPALVGATDRDVILARADVAAAPVDYTAFSGLGICLAPSGDGCHYTVIAQVATPYGPLTWARGFVAVDVEISGKAFRIVNTHLDPRNAAPGNPLSRFLQTAQAAELLQVLQYTTPADRALIVVGDFNSADFDETIPGPLPLPAPFDAGLVPPYQQFMSAGFTDAWTLRPGGVEGLSCCQFDDLSNHQSALYERVDLVFSLEAPREVKKARVVGATISDKTPPAGLGIWPSDHGSVSLTLRY
jgi:hypothetical protein